MIIRCQHISTLNADHEVTVDMAGSCFLCLGGCWPQVEMIVPPASPNELAQRVGSLMFAMCVRVRRVGQADANFLFVTLYITDLAAEREQFL